MLAPLPLHAEGPGALEVREVAPGGGPERTHQPERQHPDQGKHPQQDNGGIKLRKGLQEIEDVGHAEAPR